LHLVSQALYFTLKVKRRQTCANRMILQRHWRAKDSHQTVTGELVHRAAVPLHHRSTATDKTRHDLSQPLGADCRGDVHRTHHVREQHSHLLELRVAAGACQRRAAGVAIPGVRPMGFGATRRANYGRCGHPSPPPVPEYLLR